MKDHRAALRSQEGQRGAWRKDRKKTGLTTSPSPCPQACESESEVAQSCSALSDPMDYSLPGSFIHGFSRQEYWSGVPLPVQGIFPTQGLNPGLPHCRHTLYPLREW